LRNGTSEKRAARRRRENALADIRRAAKRHPQVASPWPEVSSSFAQLEVDYGRFDEALSILEDARALRPDPAWLERINLLAGRAAVRCQAFSRQQGKRLKPWPLLHRIPRHLFFNGFARLAAIDAIMRASGRLS